MTTPRQGLSRGDLHLLVIAVISIVMLSYAAATGDRLLAIIGAALFAQRMIFTGFSATSSRHLVGTANDDTLPPLKVVQATTRLTALTFLWAGITFLIAYPVIGLKWQHGWQYGTLAVLLACAFGAYYRQLSTPGSSTSASAAVEQSRKLSIGFAAAIAAGILWLTLSGKLATEKNDWLANDIFLAMGASVLTLAVLFVLRARNA